jgi:hypothetical protein
VTGEWQGAAISAIGWAKANSLKPIRARSCSPACITSRSLLSQPSCINGIPNVYVDLVSYTILPSTRIYALICCGLRQRPTRPPFGHQLSPAKCDSAQALSITTRRSTVSRRRALMEYCRSLRPRRTKSASPTEQSERKSSMEEGSPAGRVFSVPWFDLVEQDLACGNIPMLTYAPCFVSLLKS